ncbi:DUF1963 domain-containing protein [Streptomyces carminius]|uniref:DUF1963 domain-containing protein n=1 Tax=Streptomyces carminius TaxID=2665496 RepID=A0A2M8LRC6_9ACTN|nr:DUF1963 domain-containing protein [Streptomyces carminius]PJE94479.1 DUF1963 domain-containing protein [Streptomyces carminius]
MTPELRDRLRPFRTEAIARGIPADDVERWLDTARPCAMLTRDGDGPVVGRFGGPLLLPADVPDPAHPFVASIDLAALPAGATDLPLPPEGHLLLFAFPETAGHCETMGSVVYVPAGTAVAERDRHAWNSSGTDGCERMFSGFPQGPLRARADVSLPCHCLVDLPREPWAEPLPGHPRAEELVEVWESTRDDIAPDGPLQIGGYASEEITEIDPVDAALFHVLEAVKEGEWGGPVSDDVSDWVLLADWHAGMDVRGREGATAHWVIQREDLAARRFDRAFTHVFWNP